MNWKVALILICCLLLPITSSGQKQNKKITVTGIVIDENGIPLVGVSIFIDNLKTSTITNSDGTYKIKVKPTVRTISAFSFENGGQVMEYDRQTEMNFILARNFNPEGLKLEYAGEVVDIGYQMAERRNLTTSVGSVNMDRVSKANYTNVYDMIRGEVPGVVVSGKNIRIRGISSMNLSNEPLFVLDGAIINNIDFLNPNTIESISVLKGSAASIYGSRGTNGVIVIRSKSYKKDKQ
ncbi:MAG TPA: TonB-dependent receptor plug domain-containing protein [Bacteroidales bacterium]|nr:TonB-dependent receptor plug domain-containing protein [Bacteroidales bacterium]